MVRTIKRCMLVIYFSLRILKYILKNLYPVFQFRNKDGNLFCEYKDRLYIVVCELSKLKDKPLEDMNQMEKYIYYLRYCQKGNENSKIKAVINVNLKMYSFDHLRMYNIDHINTCCSRW